MDKQKFKRYTFVRVADNIDMYYQDCDAIIKASGKQMYDSCNLDEYSLYIIEDGKVINGCSWYKEDQLTELPIQDRLKALDMVDEFDNWRIHRNG